MTIAFSKTPFREWLEERGGVHDFHVSRIPLSELKGWGFEAGTGNIVHDSGRFFRIEGLRVRSDYGAFAEWDQPIINQPEIGLLGIIVRRVDGVLHCLMQAKMEPGNVNTLQLSPTVQATRSNYTRVHKGTGIRYLEYFAQPRRGRVLVDVLQSEHGAWFLRKRNRNMVIEIDEDIPVDDDFCWLSLDDTRALLAADNLVNMDARSVLSCLVGEGSRPRRPAAGAFEAALARSYDPGAGLHDSGELLSWFTETKALHDVTTRTVPLREVSRWHRSGGEICHEDGRYFSVVGVAVEATSREVSHWTQPLIAPHGCGVVAFLLKRVHGVLHLLVHARVEAGYLDVVELAPTVQCVPDNYRDPATQPLFLDYVLNADEARVHYSAILSEEGGRFYRAQSRYSLIETGDDFSLEVPPDYRWMTADQLGGLLKHNNYLNVQARTLLVALAALGSWR
ncbi:NDP-hexose 2,3-dehydratase family protein [Nonomuraea sp. NPDC049028]|uniref:NDP-hexose 2,3-dehydratase family protein n=1 Tax=Nonomuraea sp. NPDC049028 TaxID=3364348 RepID=UPI00371A0469